MKLAGLAVLGVIVAVGAVLLQVETIGIVTTILLGDVVAMLAHLARHRDLRSDVSGLGHGNTFFLLASCSFSGQGLTRFDPVAEAGFEPATQRL
jgi:hypothetical protein